MDDFLQPYRRRVVEWGVLARYCPECRKPCYTYHQLVGHLFHHYNTGNLEAAIKKAKDVALELIASKN